MTSLTPWCSVNLSLPLKCCYDVPSGLERLEPHPIPLLFATQQFLFKTRIYYLS